MILLNYATKMSSFIGVVHVIFNLQLGGGGGESHSVLFQTKGVSMCFLSIISSNAPAHPCYTSCLFSCEVPSKESTVIHFP